MAAKKPEDYLAQPYSRVLIPDDNGQFSAEILEFPGCYASGSSPGEAFELLEEVAKEWIKSEQEFGREIPEPYANYGFSGKIALRLPRNLHKKATILAGRDGVSLNQFLVSAIAIRVGAEDLIQRFTSRLSQTPITMNVMISETGNSVRRLPSQGPLIEAYAESGTLNLT